MSNKSQTSLVVGVGSALVDILLAESEEFSASLGHARGGMTLVERSFQDEALSRSLCQPEIVPGGSACNTIIGIGRLGGEARFVGKCGTDYFSEQFRQGLAEAGVEPELSTGKTPTGSVLSIVTPDAQRTMYTYLGASAEMLPEQVTPEILKGAAIVNVEGYLLFNRDLMNGVIHSAKEAGARISLDLAAFTVVDANLEYLTSEVVPQVDILLANEDEARSYTGQDDESAALEILSNQVPTVAVKLGDRGALIAAEGSVLDTSIAGSGGILDTTGAGDLWAAGFLYGLSHGWSVDRASALAAACGYEVCKVFGAHIPAERYRALRENFEIERE